MLGRDEPGMHYDTALFDTEIVIALAKTRAPQFAHFQSAPVDIILALEPLHGDHAVSDAFQLQVRGIGRQVVEQEHGAPSSCEIALQSKYLTPISQGIPRQ